MTRKFVEQEENRGKPPTLVVGKRYFFEFFARLFTTAAKLCGAGQSIGYFFKPESWPAIFSANNGLFLK